MSLTLSSTETQPDTLLAIQEACHRIPPLWPLQNFVAVNPFLGLSGLPFATAAQLLGKVSHSAPLMNEEYYLGRIADGSISSEDVRAALLQSANGVDPVDPLSWLGDQLRRPSRVDRLLTVAETLDLTHGTKWATFVVDELSKWASTYFDRGQCAWNMPGSIFLSIRPGSERRKLTLIRKSSAFQVSVLTSSNFQTHPKPQSDPP